MERGDDTDCSIYPLGSLSSVHLDPVPCLLGPPPMNTPVREGETVEGSRTMQRYEYFNPVYNIRFGERPSSAGGLVCVLCVVWARP